MPEISLISPQQRFHSNIGWLDSYHIFNFAENYLPDRNGFGDLLVVNEDFISPDSGFGMHPHRDMEIVTWVLSGSLVHQDNAGNKGTIIPGEVQRMSAGSGVLHSEINESIDEPVHLLQMWLLPDTKAVPPRYNQEKVDHLIENKFGCIASGSEEAPIHLHNKNASLFVGRFEDSKVETLPKNEKLFVYPAFGSVTIENKTFEQGTSILIDSANVETEISVSGKSEVIIWSIDSRARAMSRYGI